MMTYAFTFNASACTGCKTCLEACRDKNGLPAGVLWRKVIEISGGEWQATRNAWESTVFAYYLSLACNHCTHPKCAGVCPVDAFSVRPDGIVLLDGARCMGCGYCAWACPYAAPQYDEGRGVMTKCDFCFDKLEAGLPPTCVAACPLRVLDYATLEQAEALEAGQNLWQLAGSQHPFPLPNYSRTEPHLAIKSHRAMDSPLDKVVANLEEIHPPGTAKDKYGLVAFRELPLVAFTLLAQMAVGMAVFRALLTPFPKALMLSIGLLLAMGGLISFLHLGRKRNAWRSIIHLKKSWLSREILMAGLFGLTWAVTAGLEWLRVAQLSPWLLAILGIGLIYCMSRVYLLRAVPGWNTWRAPVSFCASAIALGALGIGLVAAHAALAVLAGIAMTVEFMLALTSQPFRDVAAGRLHVALLATGILGGLLLASLPQSVGEWLAFLVFFIALAADAIGRWQFYARRVPFPMASN